ncbi:MAG: SRPBCC domain-containing protein [Anaerolineales bacterium]|uniref:SRPBCC domain-containing protein n=1 Tax=Candidatus Villigracilis vicinus TaxID=3140679 RepID=UPI00313589A6|nr:SRPBCC domain-containing protein [Anaerolineales bacterium]
MKTYSATTTIHASAETVWNILTDAKGYPSWDLSMDHIEGKLALGETVKFFTKLSAQAFPVKVTAFEPGRKMVLTGGMPLGLFKSERTHTLTANQDGSITFKTEEIFSGLLLPIFGKNIPDLTENFNNFAAALKKRAENTKID